jgi:hypothetical protein
MSPQPLKKITSITILDETYDLAKNGDHFHLVEHKEPDAYLRPVARQVNLFQWIGGVEEDCISPRVQALVDLLGEAHLKVISLENELFKANAALQREAEPESKYRRPIVAREGGTIGIPVLEDEDTKS